MFHKPVLNIQNINPGTRVGIEIEICIKKKKYDKMRLRKKGGNNSEGYQNEYYLFEDNPFKVGEDDGLHHIILATDPTCICQDGFINAEIISPKMNYVEIPIFFNFLKRVVFNNPDDFYQGQTCGVHVHWSNEELKKNDDNEYLFLFFKLINNLRKKLNLKLVSSHLSGRQYYYDSPGRTFQIGIDTITGKNYFIDYHYFDIDDIESKSLHKVQMELESKEVTVFKNESLTMEVFFDKLLGDLKKNKILSKFLYHFILSNFSHFTGKENIDIVFNDEYIDERFTDFENMDVDEGVLDECAEKYLRLRLGFDKTRTVNEFRIFEECIQFITSKILYEQFIDQDLSEDFLELDYLISDGTNFFNNSESNYYLKSLQKKFSKHISKTEEKLFHYHRYTPSQLLDLIMDTQKKLPDISTYNIREGFHVEMRMFSLDSLLLGKPKVPSQNIIDELTRFLLYTENIMMNVITCLNLAYDRRTEVKRDKVEMLEDILLYGGRHSKSQLKKIGRRLFAMELVDRATGRDRRPPVGPPGKSLKNHRTKTKNSVSVGNNESMRTKRKSRKKTWSTTARENQQTSRSKKKSVRGRPKTPSSE